ESRRYFSTIVSCNIVKKDRKHEVQNYEVMFNRINECQAVFILKNPLNSARKRARTSGITL
ncbi:MAG: hypothetical protein U9N43_10130, partial [Euryarchaeota archaeon]|nr:hypothetical protein [Euryarchaeota archaeon]